MPLRQLFRRRRAASKHSMQESAGHCMPAKLDQDTVCPICLDDEDVENVVQLNRCHHAFHSACLNVWLEKNTTCPVCRTIVTGSVPVEYIGVDHIHMPLPASLPFGKALQNIARKHNRSSSLIHRLNTKKHCALSFDDASFVLADLSTHRRMGGLRRSTPERTIADVEIPHVKEIYRYGNIMLLCVSSTLDHEVKKLKVHILRHESVQTNANTLANLRSICKDVRARMGYCMTPIRLVQGTTTVQDPSSVVVTLPGMASADNTNADNTNADILTSSGESV
eukprot:m.51872 g.51872  ORF g.51872 m.51872 type:complete len:280 (+) comp13460_c0_seq1:530-1369(+)